jgi:heme-degrading monooxygenase HmoA
MSEERDSTTPILRMWRGRTRPEDAERYLEYVRRTGVRDLRATPGNLGVRVLRRVTDTAAEFYVLSTWSSMDAIRRFAGPDAERAVFYPEDEAFLLERDPLVTHFELATDEPVTTTPPPAQSRDRLADASGSELPSLLLAPPE